MKRGDNLNPGVEFFYKLSLRPEFQRDIISTRKRLGISEKGFINLETRQKLWIDFKNANILELLGEEIYFKKKYDIPFPYWQFIDDYIFFGKPTNALKDELPVAILSPTKEIEDFYREMNEPHTTLLIFSNATKTKLSDFIRKNWKEIEIEKQIGKRIRKAIYKDRNLLIKKLWQKSTKELQQEFSLTGKNKERLIAEIIEKKEMGTLKSGYIRKMRYQK